MRRGLRVIGKVAFWAITIDCYRLAFGTLMENLHEKGWIKAELDDGGDFATGVKHSNSVYEYANAGWKHAFEDLKEYMESH